MLLRCLRLALAARSRSRPYVGARGGEQATLLADDRTLRTAALGIRQGALGFVEATELDQRERTAEHGVRPLRTLGQHRVVLAQRVVRTLAHKGERRETYMVLERARIGHEAGMIGCFRRRFVTELQADEAEGVPDFGVTRISPE